MAEPRRKKSQRYLLRDSDRSGFTYRYVELIKDNGFLVGGDEFDAPPPSNRLYPGEGGVSPGFTRQNYTTYTTPSGLGITTQTVTPSGGVTLSFSPDNSNFQIRNPISAFEYLTGASSTTVITKNPQIAAGQHGDKICLECVGSTIILSNNSGVQLYTSIFKMTSGSIINLIYNATDSLWHEMTRGSIEDLQGAF